MTENEELHLMVRRGREVSVGTLKRRTRKTEGKPRAVVPQKSRERMLISVMMGEGELRKVRVPS